MSVLFRCLFRIFIFSRFFKVVIVTSNFVKKFYNGRFAPECSVSMFKETIALVRDYVSGTRKSEAKLAEKIYMKTKYEIFLQWNTKFLFLQKVLFLLHFGSCQSCMSSANLVEEMHQKLCNKRVLSTGEPCSCEYVTLPQSFHRGTLSIHWYIA